MYIIYYIYIAGSLAMMGIDNGREIPILQPHVSTWCPDFEVSSNIIIIITSYTCKCAKVVI